ncbi:hypothetical protein FGADI_12301 [Fusarium gaditjirri]|uniref:DUF6603 domain-containing protein n=1 Tax=Fusarium gaditjirri TaxID=282569 RepID=A0A8H4WNY0_9HYPO|nr:hypothetical protein FGADI_12301 [Fusarium gaditjirri]
MFDGNSVQVLAHVVRQAYGTSRNWIASLTIDMAVFPMGNSPRTISTAYSAYFSWIGFQEKPSLGYCLLGSSERCHRFLAPPRLDGPLVTLEFAGIFRVTGRFGYKSEICVPKVTKITEFPFIDQSQLNGTSDDALETLKKLTDPRSEAGGWFTLRDDTYWAAAGMKIDALQMISLDAVMAVVFVACQFAHVELGVGVPVDFDYGTMKAEGQLSSKPFILDAYCHLTGGFVLYYWFEATHPDKPLVGNFIFTLGGYHQAFRIPDRWPNPPHLRISWSLGSHLSLSGEAYFAIRPTGKET